MIIKVLGPGCINCKTLANRTLEAVQQLGIDATVEKVEDFKAIASYRILQTPGLVVDEHVVSSGRVPSLDEIRDLIVKESSKAGE